jgi:hypothetical protein
VLQTRALSEPYKNTRKGNPDMKQKTKKELCEMIDEFARERNKWRNIAKVLYHGWVVVEPGTGELKDGRQLFEEMTK